MADIATPPPAPSAPTSPIPSSAPKSTTSVAPAAPAPAAEAPKPSVGMNDFIAKMGKPAEPPKPDAAPKPPEGAAPAPVAAPEADVPVVGDEVWEKAPKNLKNSYYKFKRESESKLSEYDKKIKELESKPNQSPADLKKIQELEARSTKLEKDYQDAQERLTQADYSKSDEFKKNFVEKGNRAYQKAVSEITTLMVKSVDGEGVETQRRATQADFDEIRELKPYQQDQKINEMFGHSAFRVAAHLNTLNSVENEANEAISNANTKAEETRRVNEKKFGERSTEFKSHADKFKTDIETVHAAYFAPDPANPEATEALNNGLKYVDDAASRQHEMSPKDLAETTTMIRYLAGAAPRLMVEKKQLTEKLAALETELSKYRKSSPNSATPSAASAPVKTEARGISAMVDEMLSKGKQ